MNDQVNKVLAVSRLAKGAGVYQPNQSSPRPVTVDSPAIEVMTDLRLVAAASIGADTSMAIAQQAMIARGVRSLLVTDVAGAVLGLITARDIMGERPLQAVQRRGLRHEELTVADIMTAHDAIEVLDLGDVLAARVGQVVATLRASGRQHALVVDVDPLGGRQMVRGIFSASQVARQLGIPLSSTEIARTFAEIEAVIVGADA